MMMGITKKIQLYISKENLESVIIDYRNQNEEIDQYLFLARTKSTNSARTSRYRILLKFYNK